MSSQLRLARRAFLSAFATNVALGCSGGSSSSLSEERFAVELPMAICARNQPCCEVSGFSFDRAVCEQSSPGFDLPADPELKLAYDPETAAACVDAVRSQELRCDRDEEPFFFSASLPVECTEIYRPTVAIGEACTSGVECLQPANGGIGGVSQTNGTGYAYCLPRPGEEASICFAPGTPVRAGLGEPCGRTSCASDDFGCSTYPSFASDGVCDRAEGLYCSYASGRCESTPRVGESCATSAACADGASCTYVCDEDGQSGARCDYVCRPLPKLGEECGGANTPYFCGEGLYCGSTSCERGPGCSPVCIAVGNEDDPCDPSAFRPCLSGLDCSSARRVCVRPAKDGAPCDSTSSPPCENFSSFCDPATETCAPRREEGASCSGHEACDSALYCDRALGVCAARKRVGDSCTEAVECRTGDCSSYSDLSAAGTVTQDSTPMPTPGICRHTFYGFECGQYPDPTPTGSAAFAR